MMVPSKRRLLLCGLVVVTVASLVTYRLYPRPVRSAADLPALVGYRVQVTGEFDRSAKAYYLLYFDNTTIRLDHVNGSFSWPDTGQIVSVTGTLETYHYPGLDAGFAVTKCTWEF